MIAAVRIRFERTRLREALRQRVREAAVRRLDALDDASASELEGRGAPPDERMPDVLTKS